MKNRSRCVARLAGVVGALALSIGQVALAQQVDAQSAVFVRDSTAAQDKLSLAQRMERLKEWDTAAQVYQEVIDQYGDRVLPTHKNKQGVTDRYVSVSTVVQDRLALWPSEGRDVYLTLFEPTAKLALEQAGNDVTELGKMVNRYFVTESGRIAAIRLFNLQFEDAMFAGAGVLGDRLLNHHPDLADDEPMLMLRTAVAWKFSGDETRAALMADRLEKQFPQSNGTIGGVETNLSQWLKSTLKKPLGAQNRFSKWNTTFGSPDRNAVAYEAKLNGELGQLGLIASIPIGNDAQTNSTDSVMDDEFSDSSDRQSNDGTDYTGSQTGIMPVADGDELFINDNCSIHALSLVTGTPLAGWAASWPTTDGRFTIQNQTARLCVQSGLTLTDREVVAILDQPPPMLFRFTGVDFFSNSSRIVCLDRSNGMPRWQLTMSSLESSDDSLKATQPVGTPLVVNGRVYVATRGGRSNQFEDVFLVCLGLEDGELIWSRHLMSGSSPAQMHMVLRPAAPAAIYPAYADGRIFIASDIGAAAALNESDGSIVWLSLVERSVTQFNPRMQNNAAIYERLPAFVANPPMISHGGLWFVGTGDQTLYCFDTTDGSVKLSLDLNTIVPKGSINRYWTLCAIDDENLVLASDRYIVTLDRKKLEAGGADARRWHMTIANETGIALAGRPMVTVDSIYVPTGKDLRQIDRKRARVVGTYPSRDSWRPDEGGNVLLTRDSVVVAGADRVRIYSDLAKIQKRLLADAESDPTSPMPRLRMAQALFRSHDYENALDSLARAVELAKADKSLSQSDSILVTANTMARFFSRQKDVADNQGELIRRAFEILEQSADEPAERAACLIQAARGLTESSPADAIGLLQQILADPAMDSIQVIGPQNLSSGELSRKMIQEIVRSRGSMLMQSIDAKAQAELDTAIKAENFEQIDRVARSYPLSPAWGQAMAALAGHHESTGNIEAAIAIHQKLVRSQSDAKRSPSLAALARLNLLADHEELGLAYLKRLRAIIGDSSNSNLPAEFKTGAIKNSKGESLGNDLSSAIQFLETSLDERARMRLPLLKFNERAPGRSIVRDRITEVRDVQELVIPDWGFDHPRRVVARMSGNLMCAFEAGEVKPVWSVTSAIQSNARCFWMEDSVTLAGTEAIEQVNADGKLVWQLRVDQLKPTEPEPAIVDSDNWLRPTRNSAAGFPGTRVSPDDAARQRIVGNRRRAQIRAGGQIANFEVQAAAPPPGGPETFDQTNVSEQTIFASTTRGRVVGIDRQTGKVRWSRIISDSPPVRLAFTGALLGLIVNDSSSSRLVMLCPNTGEVVHTLTLRQGDRFVNLGSDGAGLLLALTANQLIGFDTLVNPTQQIFGPIIPSQNAMDTSLVRATRPNQIAFSRNRFAVLIDADTDSQRVGLFESNTGQLVTNHDRESNRDIPILLPVVPQPNTNSTATLRIVGDRLYVWTAQSLVSYSVSDPSSTPWPRRSVDDEPAIISHYSMPIGRDLLVAITYPRGHSTPTLETFSRAVVNGNVESGQILDMVEIERPVALTSRWLAVDGGLYAKTANGRLVFLPGSGE